MEILRGSSAALRRAQSQRTVIRLLAGLTEPQLARNKTEILAQLLVREGVLEQGSRLHRQFLGLSETRAERVMSALQHRSERIAIVLDGVHGVHNLAAVCRSCDAFGIQTVHFIPPDRYGSGADLGKFALHPAEKSRFLKQFLRAAARDTASGAHKWLSLEAHGNAAALLRQLRAQGYRIFASSVQQGRCISLYDIDFKNRDNHKCAFVFGSESSGVSAPIQENADVLFTIPMYGFVESLNVSVSVATTLAYVTRQLRDLLGESYNLPVNQKRYVLNYWLRGGSFASLGVSAVDEHAAGASRSFRDGRSSLSEFGRHFERAVWSEGLLCLRTRRETGVMDLDARDAYTRRIQNYLMRRRGGIYGELDSTRRLQAHTQTFAGLLSWMNTCVLDAKLEWAEKLIPSYRKVFRRLDELVTDDQYAKARLLDVSDLDDRWHDGGSQLCARIAWDIGKEMPGMGQKEFLAFMEVSRQVDPVSLAIRVLAEILRIDLKSQSQVVTKLSKIFGPVAVKVAGNFKSSHSFTTQTIIRLQHAADVRRMFHLCAATSELPATLRKRFLHHPRHSLYELYLYTCARASLETEFAGNAENGKLGMQLDGILRAILVDCNRMLQVEPAPRIL
jgi:tRNA (guanosine-2'-O-)-methyltransferase